MEGHGQIAFIRYSVECSAYTMDVSVGKAAAAWSRGRERPPHMGEAVLGRIRDGHLSLPFLSTPSAQQEG